MDFNAWWVLITSLIAIAAVCYFIYRVFNPFKCTCGNIYWLTNSIKKHLLHKHIWN
jgi:hypothetical protein